jgi:serine/threonine-protein kinase RsbW
MSLSMDPLTLPATLESLDPLVQYVLSAATAAGLDRKAAYRLRLAVDEIATNIITHGYAEADLAGDVVVQASVGDEQLVITLEDWAPAFDPRLQEDPDHIDKPSHERPIGGLGVFLALKSADGFDYEYRDHKNRNILTMKRSQAPAADGPEV